MAKKSYPSREERMKDLNQRLEQGIRDAVSYTHLTLPTICSV